MDCIIIGSGYAGSICARYMAEEKQKKVLVVERRNHIAGNMYDYYDEKGILVHKYGPHISVMNDEKAFNFLSRFTQWLPYEHRVDAFIDGKEVPLPINLNSINMLYEKEKAKNLIDKLLQTYGVNSNTPILKLINSEDKLIKSFGQYIYDKVFLDYTQKMWDLKPDEIDASVTARIPVRLSYDDRHFLHKFQVMPKHGYTEIFENMLDHENITVHLNRSARDVIDIDFENKNILYNGEKFTGTLIYTGALDELADYRFGQLPYRSLKFEFETFEKDYIQNVTVLNWPDKRPATRRTEMKRLTQQTKKGVTTAVTEYPGAFDDNSEVFNERMYPINTAENNALHEKYKELFAEIDGFYYLGRLADYKYYNMESTIVRAINYTNEVLSKV